VSGQRVARVFFIGSHGQAGCVGFNPETLGDFIELTGLVKTALCASLCIVMRYFNALDL
jgi:hypothetical protein